MPNLSVFNDNPIALKAQIYGSNSNHQLPIQTDSNGNLLTALTDPNGVPYNIPITAFDDIRSTNLTPMTGWTFYYNINSAFIVTSTNNGGTVGQAENMAVLTTTTANNSFAKIATRRVLRYSPGLGGLARFAAIFTLGVPNTQQIIGLGDDTDGFYFGYNGTAFSILRLQNGSPNWVAKTAWNVDKMDGSGPSGMTLDPTKGNVYSIQYQLGFGTIGFFITSTTTGLPILVHIIQYPNTAFLPSVYNPSFPLSAKVLNTGSSIVSLSTPSAMGFCEGDGYSQAIMTKNSVSASVTFSGAPTDQNVLTLLNSTLFAGKTNRVQVLITFISTSIEGAKSVTFKMLRNATFGTVLSYTAVNAATSVIQYSTTTASATGGVQVFAFEAPINSGSQLFLGSLQMSIIPGETLTLQATSINNTQLDCSLCWEELW